MVKKCLLMKINSREMETFCVGGGKNVFPRKFLPIDPHLDVNELRKG